VSVHVHGGRWRAIALGESLIDDFPYARTNGSGMLARLQSRATRSAKVIGYLAIRPAEFEALNNEI
jgi:hypothetical protein